MTEFGEVQMFILRGRNKRAAMAAVEGYREAEARRVSIFPPILLRGQEV